MKFDPKDKVIALCSRRGGGKTKLIEYIYKSYKHEFDACFVVSPTEFNGFYANVGMDPRNISQSYSNDWIMSLIAKMAAVNKNKTKEDDDFKRVLLILDDCCGDQSFRQKSKHPGFHAIVARGRHLGISLIIAMQHVRDVAPHARENTDYLFIGKTTARSKKILEEEFSDGMSKDEFMDMLKIAGEDYQFVVICNCATSSKRDDVYGIVKAMEVV